MQLPLSAIRPGNNPRKYFDPESMRELEDSIRANGVLQPILVRPVGEDNYEIVAGERRYRAARTVFGEEGTICVVVRELDDAAAEVAALVENTLRSDMSVAEEAEAASALVGKFNGDREQVAAELGWPLSKLNRRLALLEATHAVRDALTQRKISLGHAELLAAAPKDKQDKVLERVIANSIPVAVLKQQLGAISHNLEAAIFDKSDCGGCVHNSTLQGQMFTEALAVGHCTNPACFNEKTNARIEGIAAEQGENYPRIEILKAGSTIEATPLLAEGKLGVGQEQFSACHGCGNFGCTVSALPGTEGTIESNVCFDGACHTGKVSAYMKSLQSQSTEAGKETKASPGAKKDSKPKASANPNATPTKLKDYRLKVWKEALRAEMGKSIYRAGAALAAIALSGNARCIASTRVKDADEFKGVGQIGEVFKKITEKPSGELSGLLAKLPVAAVEELSESDVCKLLAAMEANLSEHWSLNKDFLALLTKSEIESLAEEVGLKAAMGENFKKTLSGKKDEVISGLLKVDNFDYSGTVPAVMRYAKETQAVLASVDTVGSEEEDESAATCCSA
ncbi:PRTRC system ParB family protein [Thiobacillus denitrificans]|uniref:PRTRC system ParB family protein n=1 Tax=Thiobacillus denitrificans TaxID=36861 RepID=UPI000360E149|nr:PRTRC system ParB family protein [Thiobacillus denitrificans]